jgi:hypothetical protein
VSSVPRAPDPALIEIARNLRDLDEPFVFLGGSVISLLLDDSAAPVRPTDDVDIAVDVTTFAAYHDLSARLLARGFTPDASEGAPICRWRLGDIVVDVMPTTANVLGFTNRWYVDAIEQSVEVELEPGLTARIVTSPYFLATKLEAFLGRGDGDYMASHDLEDVIAVIDGRHMVLDEIAAAPADVRAYLSETLRHMLATPAFIDAMPGHLPSDAASQARVLLVRSRLQNIADTW